MSSARRFMVVPPEASSKTSAPTSWRISSSARRRSRRSRQFARSWLRVGGSPTTVSRYALSGPLRLTGEIAPTCSQLHAHAVDDAVEDREHQAASEARPVVRAGGQAAVAGAASRASPRARWPRFEQGEGFRRAGLIEAVPSVLVDRASFQIVQERSRRLLLLFDQCAGRDRYAVQFCSRACSMTASDAGRLPRPCRWRC